MKERDWVDVVKKFGLGWNESV